uniref:Retrotrans_gag domain-containing protein n=1 Tax=Strongyloides venezuelensis TaxID=75913 RepID=A0A0K0FSB9_STRVS
MASNQIKFDATPLDKFRGNSKEYLDYLNKIFLISDIDVKEDFDYVKHFLRIQSNSTINLFFDTYKNTESWNRKAVQEFCNSLLSEVPNRPVNELMNLARAKKLKNENIKTYAMRLKSLLSFMNNGEKEQVILYKITSEADDNLRNCLSEISNFTFTEVISTVDEYFTINEFKRLLVPPENKTFNLRNDNGNTIPGTQIQFSSVGLNYMAGVAIDYINSAIAKVNMPDIEGSVGLNYMAGVAIDYINSAIAEVNIPDIEEFLKFTYHLSQIKIEEFNIPKSSNAFQFSSLDKLGINLQGILGKVKLETVDVTIGSTSVDAFVGISPLNGYFILNSTEVYLMTFLIYLEKRLKYVVLTRTFEGFHFDYAPTSNPESSKTSFTISIEGLIYYEEHQNDPKIPKPNYVIHPYDTNKYLCIDFDGDSVLDSAAYAFEFSKLSHLMINDNILKLFQQSIRNFFQCSRIDGICIDELIPESQLQLTEVILLFQNFTLIPPVNMLMEL